MVIYSLHELGLCLLTLPALSLNSRAKKALAFFCQLLLLLSWNFFISSVAFSPSCIRPQKTIISLFLSESPSSIGSLSSAGWTHPGPHWCGFESFLCPGCLPLNAFQFLCDLCKVLRPELNIITAWSLSCEWIVPKWAMWFYQLFPHMVLIYIVMETWGQRVDWNNLYEEFMYHRGKEGTGTGLCAW